MKATGIVRKIDNLGRIVIPMSLREGWNLDVGCPMEIFTDEDAIILKRYEPGCIFSGSIDDTIDYGGYKVSKAAIREMAAAIGIA